MLPSDLHNVLFLCNMNSVRSPMAACLFAREFGRDIDVDSAGIYPGWRDPFTEKVLSEFGLSLGDRDAKTLADIRVDDFDLIIAMTPEVAGEIRRLQTAAPVEYWDVENPSTQPGGDEAVLDAYRKVRDAIAARIAARFSADRSSENP